jgi:hypothetical protein
MRDSDAGSGLRTSNDTPASTCGRGEELQLLDGGVVQSLAVSFLADDVDVVDVLLRVSGTTSA